MRTLVEIERGLPTLADRPVQLIWGMRDWCFTPAFLGAISRILSRPPKCIDWPTPATGSSKTPMSRIIPLVEKFFEKGR